MAGPFEAGPADRPGRAGYGDVRDDYDDDFGRIRSPAESARRKLVIPAVAHIVIGILGIAGSLIGAGALLYQAFYQTFEATSEEDGISLIVLAALVLLGGTGLFAAVLAGGISMFRLRRRRRALSAAYIVSGLSIAGLYAILFFPFGIWALVVLHQSDVRREFRDRLAQVED